MKSDGSGIKLGIFLAALGVQLAYRTMRTLRRTRSVENIPTAKIASAPSGECEFQGVAWPIAGGLGRTPTGTSAVYFEFRLEERIQKRKSVEWRIVYRCSSRAPFLIADASGYALVHANESEIEAEWQIRAFTHLNTARQENLKKWVGDKVSGFPPTGFFFGLFFRRHFRVSERILCPGSPVFLHGTFHPQADGTWVTPYAGFAEFYAEAARLLSGPETALLNRFDTDQNGTLEHTEMKSGFFQMAQAAAGRSRRRLSPPPIDPKGICCAGSVRGEAGRPLYIADCLEHHLLDRLGQSHWLKLIGAVVLIALGTLFITQSV